MATTLTTNFPCHQPASECQNLLIQKMPELGEQMYCSQQICIPPTFPFLLRQFAKAAIRTQPNDLLKWATTYFRCLALNIPPPVKPRLEYPIPRDHHGMTPGWLRALLAQMVGQHTISFKTLWDRWIGACLQHNNLIQILCLGGFEDNQAIPWLRFIGLCAAHLTDSLTQSMILICEILTEEPEGGSAMIPIEIFVDLYQFLAWIDASIPQTLKNYYFLDKFLELYQEKIAKEYGEKVVEEEEEGGLSLISYESTTKTETRIGDDEVSVVSCPSVTSQDPDNYMKLLMKMRAEEEGEFEGFQPLKEEPALEEKKVEEVEEDKLDEDKEENEDEEEEEKPPEIVEEPQDQQFTVELIEETQKDIFPSDKEDIESKATQLSLEADKTEEPPKEEELKIEDDQYLMEDLERLRAVQQELMGEDDDELEKFKASILADAGLTPSQMAAPEHFTKGLEESEISISVSVKSDVTSSTEPSKKTDEDERDYELVYVDAVPGIGPKIPEEMIGAVIEYMREMAKIQHGMVMPRNIRHYECPPLEFYKD